MPSREDILVTQRIREGGSLLGIELLDHIIIGDNCYVSLAEQKRLRKSSMERNFRLWREIFTVLISGLMRSKVYDKKAGQYVEREECNCYCGRKKRSWLSAMKHMRCSREHREILKWCFR